MSDYRPAVAGFARDLIVIGASAGGIEPLVEVVRGLPADLPAAVLVVVHIPPTQRSQLPAILSRQGTLPACAAEHGTAIEGGRIYVAPPNHHLLARRGYLELSLGPRENRHARPSIPYSVRRRAPMAAASWA